MVNNLQQFLILICFTCLLISCSDNEAIKKKSKKEIYITTSKATLATFEDKETAIGSIKGIIDPTISAEISGNVIKLYARTGSLVKKGDLLAEIEAKDSGYEVEIGKFSFNANGKALGLGETDGFTKIISDAKYGQILGCHMIGSEVTELLGEISLARSLEGTPEEIAAVVHAHPSLSEVLKEAALSVKNRAIHGV